MKVVLLRLFLNNVKETLIKIVKRFFIGLAIILALLAVLPLIFSKTINNKISAWANENLDAEVKFSNIGLSFFSHFPYLTVNVYDIDLKGSAPFKNETLLKAKEVSLGINLASVFEETLAINKFYIEDGFINVQTDSLGIANYNILKSDSTKKETPQKEDSETSLRIELIKIKNTHLIYNDRSLPVLIDARGFNYTGKGKLSDAVFALTTHAQIDSLTFSYDGQEYLTNKNIDAKLLTHVNTNSLSFVFEKNELKINKLPITFTGKFAFINNGYDLDFNIVSLQSKLEHLLSILPPNYLEWTDKTKISGLSDINFSLKGQYLAEENKMPDAHLALKIKDGKLAYQDFPTPLQNLTLDLNVDLPNADPKKVILNLEKLNFNLGKDYFHSSLKVNGLEPSTIVAKIKSELDLEKFDQAVGLEAYDFKGKFSLDFNADGRYAKGIVKSGIRRIDTVIISIPVFNLKSELKDGYFKFAKLPQAIDHIGFKLNSSTKDSLLQNVNINLSDLNLNVLSNYIKGFVKVENFKNFPVDGELKGKFDLADIPKFYPIDSVIIRGIFNLDAVAKGNYLPAKRIVPVTSTELSLTNGYFKSLAYPIPIENVSIITHVTSGKGSFKDLKVDVLPITFSIANKPFELKANLHNFDNLNYKVISKGDIDLGAIYKIFAINGYDVNGFIRANLNLQGLQSDAIAGNFSKLKNFGSLEVDNIKINTDLFPKDFYIHTGRFTFFREKMLFKTFNGSYGDTRFTVNGHLSNLINYIMKPNSPLTGKFDLNSQYINANEFMAYADNNTDNNNASSNASGVILVPKELDIDFNAKVSQIKYDDLILKNFKGNVITKNGNIEMKDTGFDLIGTKVNMNASYSPKSPRKADFTYSIKADSFDIQKAYREIALFREMASSAKNAYGIVSLDYILSGSLDENMSPVMKTLKGAGTLSLDKIQFKGFKLMNNIAAKTSSSELKDASVSKVQIKSRIENNIMTIERTKMRIAGFRPRFEGQVGLDGRLNVGFRLGLPPLGIIGIPIKVTGTQENPIIKLGRQSKEDNLETEE
ncbi:hypothetical protein Pedsa_2453 [Pseudopedobacter saltans DSM 12145]|uniref:AsmA domain-containing protein n=1 Tax=Pseudopedobacter saltans (strain ATCC 51119 / DSM 12145 / JCM 21818 / CCUG 39354 / LMG 10337 / NBRC 100064 / NCIMB 13643) TaxID=762903 RepID=F0SET2_PSESL|nr:AsmA-like C-terminal region-containing protein [Pseudopedobacter saltans]ADY52998.1 hypothetical protein Pedsa_2453 [Pseudopedobacter saltans DSM 12145]